MFTLRKTFTYLFIVTLVGSLFTYTIVAKAYDVYDQDFVRVQ